MSRIQRRLLNSLVMFLCGAVTALPQGGATGAISGTVQDTSGGVIPGAEVRIFDSQIGTLVRTLRTSPDGVFTATLLPVGVYKVSVNANSFTQGDFAEIEVRVTETTRLIATLKPQEIKQEVEVNAQVERVETASAVTGQSVTANTIGNLPLATQNFQQLLTLSAGAASSLNSSASLGRGDAEIEVNGGRQDNNNYLIEGISASDFNQGVLTNTPLPSPDVVQEFKVSTSLYDATQGRNGGGNINAILKSGTADFHFDVFEFFRNTALNANNFFLNSEDQARPDIKQNIFGGSAGGPLGRKGKLGYFFANYQGTRQRSGESPGTIISTIIPVLPTDRSPQSLSQAFFGNTTTALDPVAVKLLNIQSNQFGGAGGGWLIPSLPQTPGLGPGQARLIISTPGQFTDNQFTANWDREFRNNKDRVSVRFFFSNSQSDLPFGGGELNQTFGAPPVPSDLGFPFQLPLHDRFLSFSETHLFTSTMVNELRLGYNRINSQQQNLPIVTVADLGIDRPDSNQTSDIYRFVFPNYQIGPSPTQPVLGIQNVYAVLDTLSYVRGPHDLKFGGEIDNMRLGKDFLQADNGEVFFTPLPNGLDDFQNFLIGNPIYGFAGGGVGNHNYRLNDFSLFVQDDYRATRNLTLNLGLRTEIVGAAHDLFNHIANTDPNLALAGQQPYVYPTGVNQLNVPGLVGNATSCTLRNCYSTNWNPRVGLAYDLAGHHTTSIRAGYGIYSVREDFGAVDNLSFSPPFLPIPVPAGVPGTLGTLFAVGPGQIPPAGVISPAFVPVRSQLTGFVDANGNPTTDTTQTPVFSGNVINFFGLEVPRWWIVPNTQQWNFTVQRALGSNWIIEAGYVGTKGTHLRETSDADQAQFATSQHPVTVTAANGTKYVMTQNTLANANARAPYLGLAPSAFEVFADDANSTYNSLQVTVTHRLSQGLYLLSAYTWSKSIDDTSTSNTAFDTRYNNQLNGLATRGLSDFDHSQRWITTYVYNLPFFAHEHSLAARALGGWQLSGIVTLQSGTPFTVIDSGGGTTYAESSPNLVTASLAPGNTYADGLTTGSLGSRLSHYVNINAFQLAPVVGPDGSTGFGNLGRNIYRGPKQFNWDLSLGKNFRLTERQSLWFRADFFNFTNTPSFASPSFTDVESPASFGAITSTVGTPRLIQFSAKYSF